MALEGGNLLFTSYDGLPSVSLAFSKGDAPALTNQSSLVFDTLSRLSFSDYKVAGIRTSGNLIIQNVNDGVEDIDNSDVVFTGNSSTSASGGAIYAEGTVSFSGNGAVNFSGNRTSSSGGAICAKADVNIRGNESVTFSGNEFYNFSGGAISSSDAFGGAIYAEGPVNISGNGAVNFSGNISWSDGGAICTNADVNIRGNESVSFTGNISAAYFGGAIYADGTVNISGNGAVTFLENKSNAFGGAIYAEKTVNIRENESVTFSGNISAHYSGGAIYSDEAVNIIGNKSVAFSGNSSAAASYSGGAIYAEGTVNISGNGDVVFTGNRSSYYGSDSGGAIFARVGGVQVTGNESVCFEKNYTLNGSSYYLRSVSTVADWNGLVLSAKTGGYISIYDSVYSAEITELNADYTDAEGKRQQAKGDIIFSGLYTKTHLDAILEANNEGRVATDAEILNSRTSTLGETTLYRGTLQVVDGAVLDTTSLTVEAGSSANVILRDAGLNGSSISFGAGTNLELQGTNTSTGSLTVGNAVSLTVTLDNTHLETAALTLTGSVSTGTLSLNLNVAEERATGMYRILSAGSYTSSEAWTAENVSVQGSGAAAGVTFADLLWQDGTLYFAASPVWSNYSGTMIWSNSAANWNNGSAFRAGQDVIFMDRGAGEVQLVGALSPASIHVQNTEGNDYAFTGSGKLSGATTLTKSGTGELTIATANDYIGKTDLQEGTLNVHHSTALGATATGEATLTTAAGSSLKVANSSHLVLAGDYDMAGNVDVAAGSTLELQKDGRAAGTLSGSGTVEAMNSRVSVEKISGFTGNVKVEGKNASLSITDGSYTGAGSLCVSGGTLTFGVKSNITLNAGGQLELQSWDDAVAGVTANNITVKQGATLAAKAVASELGEVPEISSHALSVDLNCARLTLNAGATLQAEGVYFDLNDSLVTFAVTTSSTEKINLALSVDTVYTGQEQIVLFANVGQVVFAYDGINTGTQIASTYQLNADHYFTGTGINQTTQLVYDQETGTVYLQGVVTIPEPATATLSLLALTVLAARRRRK